METKTNKDKDKIIQVQQFQYGNIANRELRIVPLKEWIEYKNISPKTKYIKSFSSFRKYLSLAIKSREPMNIYINTWDYDQDIRTWKKKHSKSKKYPYSDNVIIDKLFFDFDAELNIEQTEKLKAISNAKDKRMYLKELIERGLANKPLKEANYVMELLRDAFNLEPSLFFSGSKGVHLYCYINPIRLKYPSQVLRLFTLGYEQGRTYPPQYENIMAINQALLKKFHIKESTLDPIVLEPARVSRVITSKNPKTGLYVNPLPTDYILKSVEAMDIGETPIPNPEYLPPKQDLEKETLSQLLLRIDNDIKEYYEDLELEQILKPKPKARYVPKDRIAINTPEDITMLNVFPCWNNIKWEPQIATLLVGLLSYTDLEPMEVQDAQIIFWNERKHHMEKTEQGLSMVKYYMGKGYTPTSNTMKKRGLCRNCKECFRYKLILDEKYHAKLREYSQSQQ